MPNYLDEANIAKRNWMKAATNGRTKKYRCITQVLNQVLYHD